MAVEIYRKYALGEFELDADKYLLKHHNANVHLPELPFQVLLYLVEHRERYVSRHELLEKFWQGSDAYEETLTKCVSMIRTQLNDPPNTPRFIETRKKVGYRYIGPVEPIAASPPLIEEPVVGIERVRGVAISIDEDDHEPLVRQTSIPAQLLAGNSQSSRKKYILVAAAGLVALVVIFVGLFARSQWTTPPAETTAPIRSIAVIPLKNLTGDPTNDYFSDGMTESLITSLSKVEGLKVISRSSVFRFKNKDLTPQEIGKQLGVASVLEGSVRNLGQSVRVSVRLVSVDDGRVLWVSDEKERALGDIFALQDEIARNVAAGLKLQLSGKSVQEMARRYTDNVEAYQLYLQGRFYVNNLGGNEDLIKAVRYFDSAIAKDKTYALAYAGLADTYTTMALDWRNPKEVFPKAQEYARTALKLDDTLGEAHFSRGAIAYFYEWDWAEAQRELDKALELDAKSVEGNACYLHSLETLGTADEALAQIHHALEKNPSSTFISAELGCAAYYAHRYDLATDFSRETLRTHPGYGLARYNVARALGQKRMYEEAITELQPLLSAWGRTPMLISELGYNYAASGRKAEARKVLDELRRRSAAEFIDPYPLAWIHVALGEPDKALTSLEQAYEARSAWMPWIKVEPKFEPLHRDARFQDLLRRLHLA